MPPSRTLRPASSTSRQEWFRDAPAPTSGPEGYKNFIAWLDEEFSDSHAQLDALIDAGDRVVVGATLRGRGRRSGIPATFTFWQVWTVANGKVVHGQGFVEKAEALEAAGVSE